MRRNYVALVVVILAALLSAACNKNSSPTAPQTPPPSTGEPWSTPLTFVASPASVARHNNVSFEANYIVNQVGVTANNNWMAIFPDGHEAVVATLPTVTSITGAMSVGAGWSVPGDAPVGKYRFYLKRIERANNQEKTLIFPTSGEVNIT